MQLGDLSIFYCKIIAKCDVAQQNMSLYNKAVNLTALFLCKALFAACATCGLRTVKFSIPDCIMDGFYTDFSHGFLILNIHLAYIKPVKEK